MGIYLFTLYLFIFNFKRQINKAGLEIKIILFITRLIKYFKNVIGLICKNFKLLIILFVGEWSKLSTLQPSNRVPELKKQVKSYELKLFSKMELVLLDMQNF